MSPSGALLLASLLPGAAGEPRGVLVAGAVTDPAGKAVPGAQVVLAEAVPPTAARPAVRDRARTDFAGRFTVRLPPDPVERYRPQTRPLALWAYRPGLGVGLRVLPRNRPRRGEPVRLVLGKAARVALRGLGPR